MKTNLVKLFLKKEGIFWKRTWTMRKKLNWFGFAIALLLITIGHYAFALMHFLFECFLWITWRPMFRANLQKLQLQCYPS